jgi:plastocyanin
VSTATTRRRLLAGAGGLVGLAGTAGCLGGDDGAPPPEPDVTVRLTPDHRFDPGTVRVAAGETVRWENEGQRPGTVTAYEDEIPPGANYFASGGTKREVAARMLYPLVGALARGDRYHHRFETSGEYRYFSIPTEANGTEGTVVVTD